MSGRYGPASQTNLLLLQILSAPERAAGKRTSLEGPTAQLGELKKSQVMAAHHALRANIHLNVAKYFTVKIKGLK